MDLIITAGLEVGATVPRIRQGGTMRIVILICALIVATFVSPVSQAQQAGTLEEIIVTAQKREQSLQEVPISVNVVTGDVIASRNYSDLQDLTDVVPNVFVAEGGAADNLFIRGIGSGPNLGFEQSVGTFVDGVYFGRGRHSRAQFMDLERVEVLKGPQSILFGNSTIAGAFNITTRRPDMEEWGGFVSALYESEVEGREIEAAFGGPLSDTVGLRIAARTADVDGWFRNVTQGNTVLQEDATAVRLTLTAQLSESFDLAYKFEHSEYDVKDDNIQVDQCPPAAGPPGLACILLSLGTGMPATLDGTKSSGGAAPPIFPNPPPPAVYDRLPFTDSTIDVHTLTLNWELAGGQILTAITGRIETDDVKGFDPDQGPFALFAVTRNEEYEQTSQEIRLTSAADQNIEYVVGAYYQDATLTFQSEFHQNFFLPPNPFFPMGAIAQGMARSNFAQDESTLALFARVTWNLSDAVRLSGGLRYTDVEKTGDSTHGFFDADGVSPPSPGTAFLNGVIFGGVPGNIRDSFSDDDLNPEIVLEWAVSENVNTYVKYAEGFKSGGYNGDFSSNPALAIDFRFRPEFVDSFEIGAKTTLLDGAMYFNVAAFRSEYEDLQAAIFDAATTQFLVTNAGKAITQGLEVEVNWQATHNLRVDASLGFLDATYDDFPNGPCTASQLEGLATGCINGERQDLTGAPLNYAPDVSGSLRFAYDRPMGNSLRLSSYLDIKYTDEFFTALDNEPVLAPDSHSKLDFGIGLGDQDDTWDVGVLVHNVTDEKTFRAGGDMPTSNLSYIFLLEKPRTVAIQGNYRW